MIWFWPVRHHTRLKCLFPYYFSHLVPPDTLINSLISRNEFERFNPVDIISGMKFIIPHKLSRFIRTRWAGSLRAQMSSLTHFLRRFWGGGVLTTTFVFESDIKFVLLSEIIPSSGTRTGSVSALRKFSGWEGPNNSKSMLWSCSSKSPVETLNGATDENSKMRFLT